MQVSFSTEKALQSPEYHYDCYTMVPGSLCSPLLTLHFALSCFFPLFNQTLLFSFLELTREIRSISDLSTSSLLLASVYLFSQNWIALDLLFSLALAGIAFLPSSSFILFDLFVLVWVYWLFLLSLCTLSFFGAQLIVLGFSTRLSAPV